MIEMSEPEVKKLAMLLATDQDAFMQRERGEEQSHEALVRMWLTTAIRDGFWCVSAGSALLTATTLDVLMPVFNGETTVLAKRMSAYLRARIAAYEAEIRNIQGLSRH
jgi:hypothetical protein